MVELLLTILIIGILTAAALPAFSSFIAEQRIKTVSFDIMSSLILARSESIKRNTPITVTRKSGTPWISGWDVLFGTVSLNERSPISGLIITCKNGSTTTDCVDITYRVNGRLAANIPSFELSHASTSNLRCISIDLSGRPNSKVGACS